MVRRVASQVHKQVSRLTRGGQFKGTRPWFAAVLAHPPLPLPPRAPPARNDMDLHPKFQLKHARLQEIRTLPIYYMEDEIRRQFFRDHPFEAFRPTTLTEGGSIRDEHPIRGKDWTRLRQRGRKPYPEDCVLFAANLHQHHDLSLNDAYKEAVAQFRALRAEHYIASQVAALEATRRGAVFGPTQVEIDFNKETKALETWQKKKEQDLSALASRKRWRAIIERDGPIGEWTKGREYVRLWKEGVRPTYAPMVTEPKFTSAGLEVEEKLDFMGITQWK